MKEIKVMVLNINGKDYLVGSKVEVITITDYSGMASDKFGVEKQNDGWVKELYFEIISGIITLHPDFLTYMVKTDTGRYVPLSPFVRSSILRYYEDILEDEDYDQLEADLKESIHCIGAHEYISNYIKEL